MYYWVRNWEALAFDTKRLHVKSKTRYRLKVEEQEYFTTIFVDIVFNRLQKKDKVPNMFFFVLLLIWRLLAWFYKVYFIILYKLEQTKVTKKMNYLSY